MKGMNICPAQIDEILREIEGASSEFQIMIDHLEGRDLMTVFFETAAGAHHEGAEAEPRCKVKGRIGLMIVPRTWTSATCRAARRRCHGCSTTGIRGG